MERKIITIGYEIPGHSDWYYAYSASQSLLDADIIIFKPDFSSYSLDYEPHYLGKPLYDKNSSFYLQEDSQHWRKELSTALESGKTVFVFFVKYDDVFIHTGNTQYSGTGRNARATNVVTGYSNYKFFPVQLPAVIPRGGKEILFSGNPVFSSFWDTFKKYFAYESYLDGKIADPLFVTKTGDKAVGAIFRLGNGNLVLLPVLKYDEKKFVGYDSKMKQSFWTADAVKFGNSLVKALIDIDKALRKGVDRAPPPDWTSEKDFELAQEKILNKEIEDKSKEIDDLVVQKNELLTKLDQETRLRDLLFAKGKTLENAIIFALEVLGYKAENYNDGDLELDHIVTSPEGERFIGEAEGKDTSAINIDKFRQLVVNIQEDLQRVDVENPAVGILFGNGFRLTKPTERAEQFTTKCINTAKSSNCVLVRTTDLFRVAKYIKESKDVNFAKDCRSIIKGSLGKIVEFPTIPKK